jgi:hypothetical protein
MTHLSPQPDTPDSHGTVPDNKVVTENVGETDRQSVQDRSKPMVAPGNHPGHAPNPEPGHPAEPSPPSDGKQD